MLGYCSYVDRFGGTLRGVAERIPYLQELGVRYLHLLPFLRPRDGENDGGFAVASFDDVDPKLGDNRDLDTLAARLRQAGISLCSDFILNHVADDHAWAQGGRRGIARLLPRVSGPHLA
jgi:amylosucrase